MVRKAKLNPMGFSSSAASAQLRNNINVRVDIQGKINVNIYYYLETDCFLGTNNVFYFLLANEIFKISLIRNPK